MPKIIAWRPIEPLDGSLLRRRSPRLVSLARQWQIERDNLRGLGAEQALVDQMKNRMALETGVLEGLYDIDRGVTETLITEGFRSALLGTSDTDRDPAYVIALLRDQRGAVDYAFDLVTRGRGLTASVIRELHQLLTTHQPTTTAADPSGQIVQVELT